MNSEQTKRASELAREWSKRYNGPFEKARPMIEEPYVVGYAQAIADSQAEIDKLKERAGKVSACLSSIVAAYFFGAKECGGEPIEEMIYAKHIVEEWERGGMG